MSDEQERAVRDFVRWLMEVAPDYYICEDGPGYEHPDFLPLRAERGEPQRLLDQYAQYRRTQEEAEA